ncbi:MAG TPA: methyltransferase [Pseudonocardiaceae bacterium]|nr:methyltransferase [Pseudonocardiaceae bacterium]
MRANCGVKHVVATDQDERALVCARQNVTRLGLDARVDVVQADLFPAGRVPLVVCNPPWVPAQPSSPLEHAIYDPASRMLRAFLPAWPTTWNRVERVGCCFPTSPSTSG